MAIVFFRGYGFRAKVLTIAGLGLAPLPTGRRLLTAHWSMPTLLQVGGPLPSGPGIRPATTWSTACTIISQEGLRGLMRGLSINYMKVSGRQTGQGPREGLRGLMKGLSIKDLWRRWSRAVL